jgi:hypothetical protein
MSDHFPYSSRAGHRELLSRLGWLITCSVALTNTDSHFRVNHDLWIIPALFNELSAILHLGIFPMLCVAFTLGDLGVGRDRKATYHRSQLLSQTFRESLLDTS